jgi:hypothetical protein
LYCVRAPIDCERRTAHALGQLGPCARSAPRSRTGQTEVTCDRETACPPRAPTNSQNPPLNAACAARISGDRNPQAAHKIQTRCRVRPRADVCAVAIWLVGRNDHSRRRQTSCVSWSARCDGAAPHRGYARRAARAVGRGDPSRGCGRTERSVPSKDSAKRPFPEQQWTVLMSATSANLRGALARRASTAWTESGRRSFPGLTCRPADNPLSTTAAARRPWEARSVLGLASDLRACAARAHARAAARVAACLPGAAGLFSAAHASRVGLALGTFVRHDAARTSLAGEIADLSVFGDALRLRRTGRTNALHGHELAGGGGGALDGVARGQRHAFRAAGDVVAVRAARTRHAGTGLLWHPCVGDRTSDRRTGAAPGRTQTTAVTAALLVDRAGVGAALRLAACVGHGLVGHAAWSLRAERAVAAQDAEQGSGA